MPGTSTRREKRTRTQPRSTPRKPRIIRTRPARRRTNTDAIVDCEFRIADLQREVAVRWGAPPSNPHSAIRNPQLPSRPPPRPTSLPAPGALEVIVLARPERVPAELPALVAAESLRVERTNVRDGYLETAWYDTRTGRSHSGMSDVPHGRATVKLRFWADPYVPGQTRLIVEGV